MRRSNTDPLSFHTGDVTGGPVQYCAWQYSGHNIRACVSAETEERSSKAGTGRAESKQQNHMGHQDLGSWCGNVKNTAA